MASQIELLLAGFTDNSGNPLASGKIYTYVAGTTTPKDTYQNADASSTHANPIILDSVGRKLAYGDGLYKFIIKDSSDNTLYTFDNLLLGSEYAPGIYFGGTSSFTANAYGLTLSPAVIAYTTGMEVTWVAGGTNTGTSTLNLNSLGAKTLKTVDGVALIGGEIPSGAILKTVYNGTDFIIVSDSTITPTTWSPTYGTQGAGTFTSVTTNRAQYWRTGVINQYEFILSCTGTAATSPITLTATMPFTVVTIANDWPAYGSCFITGRRAASAVINGSTLYVSVYDITTVFAGAGCGFTISGRVSTV